MKNGSGPGRRELPVNFTMRLLATGLCVVGAAAVATVFRRRSANVGPVQRGASSNPGSLKGYIPPWDGRDFAELVVDEGELREWILDGRPQRLQTNALARFFLDRQAIRMPAFRGQIREEELRALEAYIGWLRAPAADSGRNLRQGATEGNLR